MIFQKTRKSRWLAPTRLCVLESLDPRIVMSADPVVLPISQLGGDFFLDFEVESFSADSISPESTLAHELTGLTAAQTKYGFLGTGQTVAVIDSGIAYDHYSLGGGFGSDYRVVGGFDFTEEWDADPYDDGPMGSHGTHVAGIIGGSDDHYPGVAPAVDLVGLRVFNDQGAGYFSWVENALSWVHDNQFAFKNPITTVNLSLGTEFNGDTIPNWAMLEDEFAQLEADGIFISVAAGNNFQDYAAVGLSYPAVSEHVVAVSSVDNDGSLSYFSQRSDRVIAAPGRNIISSVPDYVGNFNRITDDFARYSGTSMAAPYVAGASVVIREAMQSVGFASITQDDIYDVMQQTADLIDDPVTNASYHRLNVLRAVETVLATSLPSINLGTVDFGRISAANSAGGGAYSLQATRDGTLTVILETTGSLADVQVQVFDDNGTEIASASQMSQSGRIDLQVTAGERFRIDIGISSALVDVTIANLVSLDAGVLTVFGTTADDHFAFSAGATHNVTIKGINYQYTDTAINQINYDALTGAHDTAKLTGTEGNETALANPGNASMVGDAYQVSVIGTESIQFDGGAGYDSITLFDSYGNDTFTGGASESSIQGQGFLNMARGFDVVIAQVLRGGDDTALLYDSAGFEKYTATSYWQSMIGADFYYVASGFDRSIAKSSGGGDTAQLFDSYGNDTLTAHPFSVRLQGESFNNYVRSFGQVTATSNSGGQDLARMFDSYGNDVFSASGESSMMQGAGFENRAIGFATVVAKAIRGGYDVANYSDSVNNDIYYATSYWQSMSGGGSYISTSAFDASHAVSSHGGSDQVQMIGSAVDDAFSSLNDWAELRAGHFLNDIRGFSTVRIDLATGGNDTKNLQAVDYVLTVLT